jgi:ketopantoate reductase
MERVREPDRDVARVLSGTSMRADRRLELPLEVDARNAAVAGIGARHGIVPSRSKALTAVLVAIHAEP